MTDLLFALPRTTSADLLFGQTGAPVVEYQDLSLAGTLPRLSFAARSVPDAKADLAATLPALSFSAHSVPVEPDTNATIDGTLPALSFAARSIPDAKADLADTLPALSFSAHSIPDAKALLAAAFPQITMSASAEYNSRAARPVAAHTLASHQSAGAHPVWAQVLNQSAPAAPHTVKDRWDSATTASVRASAGHGAGVPSRIVGHAGFQAAKKLTAADITAPHQEAIRVRINALPVFQPAGHSYTPAVSARHQDGLVIRQSRASRFETAARSGANRTTKAGAGLDFPIYLHSQFQDGMQPAVGAWTPPEPPGPPPCYAKSTDLLFKFPRFVGGALVYNCDNWQPEVPPARAGIVIPTRTLYMVVNQVTLHRADTGQEINAPTLSLSLDADSWSWGWQASVPASSLPMLTADPGDMIELIAVVNGTEFRLSLESMQRDRSFGKASLRIAGRSRAAWLASPLANAVTRTNATAMTAQQLMADALTENGQSIGWSLDWNITDWLVPAGAWSHTGSAIEACTTIASAAGAYLQAHRKDKILRVLPRYPSAPWEWGTMTPDIELPEAVCVTEGIEYVSQPAYNRVFVSGTTAGVTGQITRAGTAGNIIAPMVTDPLITHADAARQRGLSILANTDRQKHITLSLPILPETGIIQPGTTVRYVEQGTEHIGITRAVSVTANFPNVKQQLRIESHVI